MLTGKIKELRTALLKRLADRDMTRKIKQRVRHFESKERREQEEQIKSLADLIDKVETLTSEFAAILDFRTRVATLKNNLASLNDEAKAFRTREQEAYEALPASLQQGMHGEIMRQELSNMEQAISALEAIDAQMGVVLVALDGLQE